MISGKLGAIQIQTVAASAAFTDQATTKNGTYDVYYITDRSKAYWDKSSPITVKKNGATITTGFIIEGCGGFIRFTVPNIVTDAITVSGKSYTMSAAGGFTNWSIDLGADLVDVTTFGSNGWKESQPSLNEWSASAEAFWGDASFLTSLGQEMVFSFYVDSGANKYRYEGYGLLNADGIEVSVDEMIKESIEIKGNGKLYYREG